MSDIYYEIECASDGTCFAPKFVWRLERSRSWLSERCRYQDLMTGTCPTCGVVRFNWLEVGFVDDVFERHPISTNNHSKWMARVDEEKARRINQRKPSGSVQGSLNVYPWSFRGLIPIKN